MKKLLLSTLALFSVVGLTACGEKSKKLSADEAKAKFEEIAKANANVKSFKMTGSMEETIKGTMSMEAPGVTKQSYSPDVKETASVEGIVNKNDFYSKISQKSSISGVDTLLGTLITPEIKEMLDELQKEQTVETYSVVKDGTLQEYHLINGKLDDYDEYPFFGNDSEEISEEDINELVTSITTSFDEAKKYLNMDAFSMKGNTLSCDKTIIDKDKLNKILAEDDAPFTADDLVITFNKFELVLNKDNTIKEANIDVKATFKSKQTENGATMDVNFTMQTKTSMKFEYGSYTVTVPESVIKAAEDLEM